MAEIPGRSLLFLSILGLVFSLTHGQSRAQSGLEQRVQVALETTWPHGVSEEVALREVGLDGVPHLLVQLARPDCARPDNVVAFLSALAGDEAVEGLLEHLNRPRAAPLSPCEDRSLLLVPYALGRIAERGGESALSLLLELSAPDQSRTGLIHRPLGEDLLRMTLSGLGRAGGPQARMRLAEWAGAEPPLSLSLRARAAAALARVPPDGQPGAGGGFRESVPRPLILDVEERVHGQGLSWVNHVSLANPMTTARLRRSLRDVNLRAARADIEGDTACCIELHAEGLPGTFGVVGDGLDIVETASEAAAVLGQSGAHVKVVRLIQFCGGLEAPNIGGCALVGVPTMMVIRGPSPTIDGLLWLHEYGHNVGIAEHDERPLFIMGGLTTQTNVALSPEQCAAFHRPVESSGIVPEDLGACEDVDVDGVHDLADNCRDRANPGQEDLDGDGQGDVCDLCPGDGGPDADLDGVCDDEDRCPLINDLFDTDTDGVPDCLDGCPLDARKSEAGDCGCGEVETDRDGDGVADCADACPDEPAKTSPGECGCALPEDDQDQDGAPDCIDACPADPLKLAPGACGCGISDDDTDGDGALNCEEDCPSDPLKLEAGACGCGLPDLDSDGDGLLDCFDACPFHPSKTEPGACGCERSDSDEDADGSPDCLDDCPLNPFKQAPGACSCELLETDADGSGEPDCLEGLLGDVDPAQGDGDVDLADWFTARSGLQDGGASPSSFRVLADLAPLALREEGVAAPLAWCAAGDGVFDSSDLAVLRAVAAGVARLQCRRARMPDTSLRRLPGDIDSPEGDGRVDVRDVIVALTLAVGIGTPHEEQLLRGDLAPALEEGGWQTPVGDGSLNVRDVILVLQTAVGASQVRWPLRELAVEWSSEVPAVALQLRVTGWPTWATDARADSPPCEGDASSGLDVAGDLLVQTCAPSPALTGPVELLRLQYRAVEALAPEALGLHARFLTEDLEFGQAEARFIE